MAEIKKTDLVDILLEIMPCNIYWKDLEGKYLGCNKQQVHYLKLENPSELVGKTDFDILPSKDAERIKQADKQVIQQKAAVTAEEEVLTSDNEKKTFLSKKVPVFDDNNNVIGIAGISFDITAEKEAERLQQETELAEKRALFFKQAAGSIAHDLRTPLATIQNYTFILGMYMPDIVEGYKKAYETDLVSPPSEDDTLDLVLNIGKDIKQRISYINHFIDMILGNLNHDTVQTKYYKNFNIAEVVKKNVETYPYERSDDSGKVHLNVETDFEVWGDKYYLENIINNLFKNAFHYMRVAGKGEVHVWLEQGEKENYLHIKDTCKGAPKEICEKMFDPYISDRDGGTGLGLAFCKSIMESFKGSIRAESVEGEYMHFILAFPKLED